MGAQIVPGGFTVGYPSAWAGLPNLFGTVLITDAANEEVGFVFRAPKSGNIRKVHFQVHTVTSAPTSNHTVSIQTVDLTTGLNSGTIVGGGSPASVTALLDTPGWKTLTLTNDAAVTIGTPYAIVVKAPATNFGNIGLTHFPDEGGDYPYTLVAGAKGSSATSGVFSVEYSDGTFEVIPGIWPISVVNTRTFNSSSNPNRRALRFKWPGPTRLIGCRIVIDADGDFDIVFYGSDGATATTLLSVDKDIRAGSAATMQHLRFDTYATIQANTFYRLALVPGASNISIYDADVASAAILDAMPGGQNFHLSTADGPPANEAAWTQTLTNRPFIYPIFDQIDDGTGGGGVVIAGSPVRRGMV